MASVIAADGVEATRIPVAPTSRAAPAARRIEALDFVRGVALLGILLINIVGFGLADAQLNPMNAGGAEGANLLVWIVMQIGVEGTQRALFSMLFGASAILLVSRLEAAGRGDAADIYMRRNLWLIGFGFVNAYVLLWWGDILYAYGIAALALFPFRKLSARWLLATGAFVLLLAALWNLHDSLEMLRKHDAGEAAQLQLDAGNALTTKQEQAIYAWEDARASFQAVPENVAAVDARMQAGYWSAFERARQINLMWQTWGTYRFFFDVFGMMLIGMGLFRAGVLTLERRTGLYVAMMAGGYAVGLTVNFLETRWIIDHQFGALAFAQANVSYDLGRLAMTIGHLGALLLFVRSGMLGFIRRAFAAVGQMAFTNYLMHSAIALVLFVGLGWFGQLERYQLYYVVAGIWAFQIGFSMLWLYWFRFGPLEWLWRWLTYLQRPPIRREAA
ncbi:MAG: DUF418 domain-containing protein [Sphingomonas sp.]|nr:DUF418 domain-containing protein [Sphingomonas sp.]